MSRGTIKLRIDGNRDEGNWNYNFRKGEEQFYIKSEIVDGHYILSYIHHDPFHVFPQSYKPFGVAHTIEEADERLYCKALELFTIFTDGYQLEYELDDQRANGKKEIEVRS